jgi:uncharacterized glyoxalase superfamily protein PhnB
MAKAKPVPDGTHTLTPHLTVKGADKAIDFYKRAFGAQEISRYAGPGGNIMHASIRIGDSQLFLNDEFPQMGAKSPLAFGGSAVTLTLYVEDVDTVFKRAVDAGAKSTMPVADQFWGDRYGTLTDPFGHQWAIATHKEDLTPAELEKRGREAMAQMK